MRGTTQNSHTEVTAATMELDNMMPSPSFYQFRDSLDTRTNLEKHIVE